MDRPSFLEPLPNLKPTVMDTLLDLAEADYNNRLADDWDSISFWEWRIRSLESCRTRYTRKAAWSIRDLAEVDEIDESLKEAYTRINNLQTA
jgi:hypothetical protein